jgi:hypothetical protein
VLVQEVRQEIYESTDEGGCKPWLSQYLECQDMAELASVNPVMDRGPYHMIHIVRYIQREMHEYKRAVGNHRI